MSTAPMKPIFTLKVGDRIAPRLPLDRNAVTDWIYPPKCPQIFSTLMPGTALEISELDPAVGSGWVKVYVPDTRNSVALRIPERALAANFLLFTDVREFDVDAATRHLAENAQPGSLGRCATYVRQALEAGGLELRSHPVSAKDYGPYLLRQGFRSLPVDRQSIQPRKGDVVVIQSYTGGDPNGHIAMYDGATWISDFKQRDMWGGPGYRQYQPSYAIYRP